MLAICDFSFFCEPQLEATILSLNGLRQILASEAKKMAPRYLKEGPSVRQLVHANLE